MQYDYKIMIRVGDDDYVGLFDDPIQAVNYATKHFKDKEWSITTIAIKLS